MATVHEKMTAIADAIRAKTGESSDVKYGLDAMVEAIAALGTGGGSKVAVGAFTPSTEHIYNNSVYVQGMDFKPRIVFVVLQGSYTSTDSLYRLVCLYHNEDESPSTIAIKIRESSSSAWSQLSYGDNKSYATYYRLITLNNGFGIQINDSNSSYRIIPKKYQYIAVG